MESAAPWMMLLLAGLALVVAVSVLAKLLRWARRRGIPAGVCPYCREAMKAEASVCPHCRARVM